MLVCMSQAQLAPMEGHTGIVLCVGVSNDGSLLASGAGDNQIRLWDVPKNAPVTSITAHDAAATAVSVTTDGLMALLVRERVIVVGERARVAGCAATVSDVAPGAGRSVTGYREAPRALQLRGPGIAHAKGRRPTDLAAEPLPG